MRTVRKEKCGAGESEAENEKGWSKEEQTSHGKMELKCGWRENDGSGWRMEREKRDAR